MVKKMYYITSDAGVKNGRFGLPKLPFDASSHGYVIRGLKIHGKNLLVPINTRVVAIFAVWRNGGVRQIVYYKNTYFLGVQKNA